MLDLEAPARTLAAPVREFILKVASRCNLDCDYCYEYRHGDDTWRSTSKLMSRSIYEAAAQRIATHALTHGLRDVGVSLHGGEPLLLGAKRLDELASALRSTIEVGSTQLTLTMQTNAMFITEEVARVIRQQRIHVGVSLDGGLAANDRHRRDHRGRTSHARVVAGIETLQRTAPEFANGLLAVIDVENDPLETFDALAATGFRSIDFLLPHHNWDRLPPRPAGRPSYGEWLGTIWRAWVEGRHSHIRIRFLDNIVARLVGHPGLYEQMSGAPVQLITINADGDIEGVDTLKSTGTGIQKTGLNIMRHDIDAVLTHPTYTARQDWERGLPTACADCAIKSICTGGYLPHRYRAATGFDNPSVFCDDIQFIVDAVERTIRQPRVVA